MHRAEVITVERRRRWSWSDKQQIVAEALVPGARISAVARRYGLHPSQVFAWRKAVREEEGLAEAAGSVVVDYGLMPVVVTGRSPLPQTGSLACGRMEIVLVSGHRIVVDASVEAAALDRVVNVLERR
jgi:transposase